MDNIITALKRENGEAPKDAKITAAAVAGIFAGFVLIGIIIWACTSQHYKMPCRGSRKQGGSGV
jgi:hypothetical protein